MADEDSLFVEWSLLERLYAKIAKTYQPRRMFCRGILVRADRIDANGTILPMDDSLGWRDLFTGGLEIIPIIGDHDSIVREHNPTLAQKLNDALKRRWPNRKDKVSIEAHESERIDERSDSPPNGSRPGLASATVCDSGKDRL